ncbi:MAG: hypothetical protein RLN81_10335 [Balneolaceae bacterium]
MKSLFRALSIFTILILVTNCSTGTDSNEDPIAGDWNLKTITGGFGGVDNSFQNGEVLWTFNVDDSTLTVEVNIISMVPTERYYGLQAGTYSYELIEENEQTILHADGSRVGTLRFSENDLLIDEGIAVDGFLYTFTD